MPKSIAPRTMLVTARFKPTTYSWSAAEAETSRDPSPLRSIFVEFAAAFHPIGAVFVSVAPSAVTPTPAPSNS